MSAGSDGSSPQPTLEGGNLDFSRREALRLAALTGAAAIGGSAASSGTVAAVPTCTSNVGVCGEAYDGTNPDTTSAGFFAGDATMSGVNDDPSADEVALHGQATTARAWWDDVATILLDNRLEDMSMVSNIAARAEIADAYQDGAGSNAAYDAALAGIDDQHSVLYRNTVATKVANLSQLSAISDVCRSTDGLNDRFVSWAPANDNYSGSGSIVQSGTYIAPDLTASSITLPNGDTYDVDVPEFHAEWDNGDTLTVKLDDDLLGHYDADAEEFVDVPTDNGEMVTFRAACVVNSVSDADLESKTVGVLADAAGVLNDIETNAAAVKGNYDQQLVDDLYAAMDDGTISPSDIRGVEGMAGHLSGSTDATDSRFQMALLAQLGLDRSDLSSVASMTLEYTGVTDRTLERDSAGKVSNLDYATLHEAEPIEGQLFADLRENTTLSAGETYQSGTNVYLNGSAYDPVGGERLTNSDGGTGYALHRPSNTAWTCSGTSLYKFDVIDGTSEHLWEESSDTGDMSHAAIGSARDVLVAASGYDSVGVFGIDPETGDELWNFNPESNTKTLALDAEGTVLAHGDSLGNVACYDVDSEDYSKRWSNGPFDVTNGVDVVDGVVYAVGKNGDVKAYDLADGTELWSSSYSSDGYSALAADYAGNEVYAGYSSGDVVALEAGSGSENWSVSTNVSDAGSMILDARGHLWFNDRNGLLVQIDTADGTIVREHDVGDWAKDMATTDPRAVNGMVFNAIAYDGPSGESISLNYGSVTVQSLTDQDGNELEDDYEADWDRPEHDTVEIEEYQQELEKWSTEYENALEDEDDDSTDDGDDWLGLPSFGSFESGDLAGLAIIGGILMVIIGIATDYIPFVGGGR
ncbi:PQQ-like domain-containing protein [Halobiforma haloterrestris]|uniref:PQQ-like domain-containing protein n=1 Tax=Natronobacterium haloterrestre TaxID=148448 RepID=A0A1I1KWS7_NATHA|nr:PQQ-binding-like beta-propeller repeat protein [Halobiforma haloterrestris]SFC65249.1 PQQ-like domain-containing protein [Halobiforma haloterrestris]